MGTQKKNKTEARLSIDADILLFAKVQAAKEGFRGPGPLVEKLLREYQEKVEHG